MRRIATRCAALCWYRMWTNVALSAHHPATSKGRERESIEPRQKRWSEREATGRAFRERRGGSGAAILGGEGKMRGTSAHDTGGGWHGGQEAAMAIRVKGRG
jgi:hypothetical protein